jgi:hypothetical protein
MQRFTLLFLAALLLLSGCVKPRAWKAAVAQARANGVIDVDARLASDTGFCHDVVAHMRAGRMVRCSPGADITVRTDLTVGPPDHRSHPEDHAVEYIAAVYEVPNPRHHDAEHRLERATEALAEALERRAHARRHGQPTDDLDELVHARREEEARAERLHHGIPATVLEEEIATYGWTSIHHLWNARYGWTATLSGAGASMSRSGSGDVAFEGIEQPGFEPAGIRARQAYAPNRARVRGAATNRTAVGVARMLDEQLSRVAALRERACPPTPRLTDDDAWLECRAEVKLLRGQAPFPP